ncbi:MAG: LPP20 family lipoprotein [bacterium]|nr:LPP20 family lipoprotein [bacterium]
MKKHVLLLATLILVLLFVPAVIGQTMSDAQAKLMAKRAAQADAYRNLSEQVLGFRLTSETLVRDFVTQNDTIHTRLNTFIKGIEVTDVRYEEDGTCQVTVLMKQAELEKILGRRLARRYGDIIAYGYGVPPPPEPVVATPPPTEEVPATPEWATRVIKVTGSGVAPATGSAAQKKLMAKRAAQVDGYRLLAEQVKGVRIDAETTVENFMTKDDTIRTNVNTFIRGARVVGVRYLSDGTCEVDIALALDRLVPLIYR